jgi:hypothetical protein
MANLKRDNIMNTSGRITLLVLFVIFLILGACVDSDDTTPSPTPDVRDKFVGNWSVNNENCGKNKYLVTISKDPDMAERVLIFNFGFSNSGEPDTAIISGNTITLYPQFNSEGWEIKGSGNYNNSGDINWSYSLLISGTLENCTATYVKN